MSEVIIREASTPTEIKAIRGLMRDYAAHLAANPGGADAICLDGYEAELQSLPGLYGPPGGVLLLALRDGVPVGCCAAKPIKHPRSGERSCEMKRLWIGPNARGLGLGRLLVERTLAWARHAGYTAVYLDTVPAAMPQANRLYATLGFTEVERFNDNQVPNIVFFRRGLDDITIPA